MSYIYEALKRAETENERAAASPRSVARRAMFFGRRPRWALWLVSAGIAANVAVLSFVIVRQRPSVAPVIVAPEVRSEARAPVAPVVPVAKDARVPEPVTPPKPAPPVSAPPVPPVTARVPEATALVPPSTTRVPAPSERPVERPFERRPPTTAPTPVVPVPPGEAMAPPPPAPITAPTVTSLQVIVYSEIPAQRMVFIDGRRYREGDAFDAETVLESISADGIVMKRRGQRFVIADPRR